MNVLIVKLGAIGDVVMASPMVAAARRLDPDARVTWVCGLAVEPLLRALGTIDELVAVDEAALLKGTRAQQSTVLLEAWRHLAGRHFDLILTGYRDRRYQLLTVSARGGVRRSFSSGRRPGLVPGRYHGDEYVRLVLGEDGPQAPRLPLPQPVFELAPELRRMLGQNGIKTVVLAPGGAKNLLRDDALRRWPLENYVELASELAREGVSIVLAGGPSDDWVRKPFASVPCVDLVGQTDLLQLAALFQASSLVITHDSGPMHLAALAGAPLIALFGPTQPEEKVRESITTRVFWGGAELACRPCYDGVTYAPCRNNVCIQGVTVSQVREAAHELLGTAAHSPPPRR